MRRLEAVMTLPLPQSVPAAPHGRINIGTSFPKFWAAAQAEALQWQEWPCKKSKRETHITIPSKYLHNRQSLEEGKAWV
jgi:hypothetical protein